VSAQHALVAACKASAMLDAAIALVGSNPDPDPKVSYSCQAGLLPGRAVARLGSSQAGQ